MSTLTIHALDKRVERLIRAKAKNTGKSLNQTLKELLASSVGITEESSNDNTYSDFSEFCGIWDQKQYNDFHAAITDLSQVDPQEWN